MSITHYQIGAVHFFFHQNPDEEGEYEIVIKAKSYRHKTHHGGKNLKEAKAHAIKTALKLGLITPEEANSQTFN